MTTIIARRQFTLPFRSDFIFHFTSLYKKQQKLLSILHGLTDSVIVARRNELAKAPLDLDDDVDEVGAKRKLAMLDILLQSKIDGKPLSNMDIREEVDTFLFAGHDTTTSAIAFCLYNLAKNPEVQQKAYDEIVNVIGEDKDKPITQKDLNDLHYLEMIIKENLRLYPAVPFIGRRMKEDVSISESLLDKLPSKSKSFLQMESSCRKDRASEYRLI